MRTFLYSYNPRSESAMLLAQSLGVNRIRHQNSRYVPRPTDTIINWGSSDLPDWSQRVGRIINRPEAVRLASHKLRFLRHLKDVGSEVRVPDWTTSREEAKSWLNERRCRRIFVRTVLQGHSGEGIVVVHDADALNSHPDGSLFVAYKPKVHEYRLHVGGGEVFRAQRKSIPAGIELSPEKFWIRNHGNGFIYTTGNVGNIRPRWMQMAVAAVRDLGLDFGAVDMIYNNREEQMYVLEVNTAPGLEGSTLLDYSSNLRNYLNGAQ